MRIVLHAGFHKTGTTSVQEALAAHAGVLAPQIAVKTRTLSPALVTAAEAARDFSIGRLDEAALCAALEAWVADLPPAPGLILSCEDLAGHMPGRPGVVDYRAAAVIVPRAAAALLARFPAASLSVVLTTRAAAGWLPSIHWQLAKGGQMRLKQRRFLRDFAGAAEFAPILQAVAAELPAPARLVPLALESTAGLRLGPVEPLYDLAGLDPPGIAALPALPPANRRPPVDLADSFVELNRSDLPRPEVDRIKKDMLALWRVLGAEGLSPDAPPR